MLSTTIDRAVSHDVVSGRTWAVACVAAAYAALHWPFLASGLDDIDGVNFALGLRDFDVAAHQPHPPGYPVYIALGRLSLAAIRTAVPSFTGPPAEALALSVVSLLGGVVAILAGWQVFAALHARTAENRAVVPLMAAVLLAAAPLFWISGLRPMSDMPGLAWALVAQALLLRASVHAPRLPLAALVTGVAAGVRSQCAWLTLPLLAYAAFAHRRAGWRWLLSHAAVPVLAGALSWAVPMVIATAGLGPYLQAVAIQAGDDVAAVDMLWEDAAPRRIVSALHETFLLPWGWTPLAGAVLAAAALGAVVMVRRHRRQVLPFAVAFGPYAVFHLLVQDAATVRYALPLVPPIALLAAYGLASVARAPLVWGVCASAALLVAVPAGVQYGRETHPVLRAIADARQRARVDPPAAVIAHHSIWRMLQADPGGLPLVEPQRRYEWLAAANYWRGGGTGPVWFLANPHRTDIALVDPRTRSDVTRYAWNARRLPALGGARPIGVDWYRLGPPEWFVTEGWALTPETAGVATATGKGPHLAPIQAYVRRRRGAMHLLVGGRHLGAVTDPAARFQLAIDGIAVGDWLLTPSEGKFLRVVDLPNGLPDAADAYATVSIAAVTEGVGSPVPVAIDQFDVRAADRLIWGFAEGWHEDELDPDTGERWRWTSERAVLRIAGPPQPVRVTLAGESPLNYFDAAPLVRLTAAGRVIAEFRPDTDFRWDVVVPAADLARAGGAVIVEIDRAYIPAQAEGSADQRRLGLRVYEAAVTPP